MPNIELSGLRWWDADGNLLLSGEERAIREKERGDRRAARLRELGVDPDNLDG